MKRIRRICRELIGILRGWVAKRRLRAETATDLIGIVADLRSRIGELEADLDELRADSRRVAEMRIQVENFLAEKR